MRQSDPPALVGLSEGLGPNAALVERLRATAHWQLTEGNGDDATHQALQAAIAEIERLAELADSEGTRAVNYLRRARKAEKVLRELVALEDMRLRLRQLHEMGHGTDYADYYRLLPLAWAEAREALGPNVRANLEPTR